VLSQTEISLITKLREIQNYISGPIEKLENIGKIQTEGRRLQDAIRTCQDSQIDGLDYLRNKELITRAIYEIDNLMSFGFRKFQINPELRLKTSAKFKAIEDLIIEDRTPLYFIHYKTAQTNAEDSSVMIMKMFKGIWGFHVPENFKGRIIDVSEAPERF